MEAIFQAALISLFFIFILYQILYQRMLLLYSVAVANGEDVRVRRQRRFKRFDRSNDLFTQLMAGDDGRFMEAYRMSKNTFHYILTAIERDITKINVVGDSIPPAKRLAIALHRLCRGSYYYSIAENYGVGETTAQQITLEVTRAIINRLYERHVTDLLPKSRNDMEQMQNLSFPHAWAAVDGCHIKIKCPSGRTAKRDYFNFKNFYSIILMAMVDYKYRFVWCAAGMPGNCHDSTLIQSCKIWNKLDGICNLNVTNVNGVDVPAVILGDNAFPFRTFLMKRYSQSRLTPSQKKFNKLHSRSRIVVENAFGYLKARFRECFRGTESNPTNAKHAVLACVTIHNILISRDEPMPAFNQANEIQMLEPANNVENNAAAHRVRNALLPLCQ